MSRFPVIARTWATRCRLPIAVLLSFAAAGRAQEVCDNDSVSISGPATRTVGQNADLTAEVSGVDGESILDWFVDGPGKIIEISADRRTIKVRCTGVGTITVFLAFVDTACGTFRTRMKTINVTEAGCAESADGVTIAGPADVEVLETVTLSATAMGVDGAQSFAWDVKSGPGAIDGAASGSTVRVRCTQEGTVVVRLRYSDSRCDNTLTREHSIDVTPCSEGSDSVTISGPAEVEVRETVTLSATATGVDGAQSFAWDVKSGPGTIDGAANGSTVRVRCTGEGTVVARLRYSDSRCDNTLTREHSIDVTPCSEGSDSVTISGPAAAEVGETVTLGATATGVDGAQTFTWAVKSGPGAIVGAANGRTVDVRGTANGTVIVELQYRDSRCDNTLTREHSIRVESCQERPDRVTISGPGAAEAGETVDLHADATGGDGVESFEWSVVSGPGRLVGMAGEPDFRCECTGVGDVVVRVAFEDGVCADSARDDHTVRCTEPFVPGDFEAPVRAGAATNPWELVTGLRDACPASGKFGRSVFFHNGENREDRVDLVIPGRGEIDFVLRRRYRSRIRYDGPLGRNWDFDHNERLVVEPFGVTRVSGAGHADAWIQSPGGGFTAPRGFFGTLIQEDDGSYILREPTGLKLYYAADGRLTAREDRHHNRMLYEYDARGRLARVIDAFGRPIEFRFEKQSDGRDRLARVRDFLGREVRYSYDGNGDLVAVRAPVVTGTSTGNDFPAGRTERYVYSSGFLLEDLNHNLLRVIRPEEAASGGPEAMAWTYGTDPGDPATFDRVVAGTIGGTNASGIPAGGTFTLEYEPLDAAAPPGDLALPRLRTTFTDREGNTSEHYFNERQQRILVRKLTRGLRAGEPAAYETRYEYNDDDLLVRLIEPAGNGVELRYGTGGRASKRNLVQIRRIADPERGGGADLVTRLAYDPLVNTLVQVIDPRGNAVAFEPPIGESSPERYMLLALCDFQEGTAPIPDVVKFGLDISGSPRGLGDLNGDGRTDQVAGDVVRVIAPAVTLLPGSHEAERLGTTRQEIITERQWNDRGQLLRTIDAEGNVTEYEYYPEDDPDGDGAAIARLAAAGAAAGTELTGYLAAVLRDAATSPRRTAEAPPARLETRFGYDPAGNVTSVRNPRGVVTELEVNALNEIVAVTRGADVSEAVASGELITGENAYGFLTRFHYDHNGRVVHSEVENRGEASPSAGDFVERTFVYDILDHVVEHAVETGGGEPIVTSFGWDGNELLARVVRPVGNEVRTTYDERGLVFEVTRGPGSADGSTEESTVRFDHDANGNLERRIDAEDSDGDGEREETRFAYDGFDRRVLVVDALGNELRVTYDPASNVIAAERWGHPPGAFSAEGAAAGGGAARNVLLASRRFRHDELSRVFAIDDALFLAAGFEPARAVDLRDEDSDGFVTTRFEHDALSRRTFLVEDDGEATRFTYDGASRLVEIRDALGNRLITDHDRNSNPVRVRAIEVSPEGLVPDEVFTTHRVYDQLDRLVRVTDNAGQTSRFKYDSRDNLVRVSDAEGPLLDDPLGLFPAAGQSGRINAEGNTTEYVYDGLDRVLEVIRDLRIGGRGSRDLDLSNPHNPDGQVSVAYFWDANSRLAAIADDNGNTTTFEYDALDRRVVQRMADGREYLFSYDRDSDLRESSDPNGTLVRRRYDAIGRVVRIDVERGEGVEGTKLALFEYDGLSRSTRSADDNGLGAELAQVTEIVYDSLSRPLEERQIGPADAAVVSSVYSGDGKRLSCTYPGGRTIESAFDTLDRVAAIADGDGEIARFAWVGPGYRELERRLGNGVIETRLDGEGASGSGYDSVRRLVRSRSFLPDASEPFLDRAWGYNRAGRRTFERRVEDGGLADVFRYDSLYRLVAAHLDQGAAAEEGARGSASYLLDGAGNRREVVRHTGRADPRLAAVANPEPAELHLPAAVANLEPEELHLPARAQAGGGAALDRPPQGGAAGFDAAGLEPLAHAAIARLRPPAGIHLRGRERYEVNELNEYVQVGGVAREHDANGNLTADGERRFAYDYRNRLVGVIDQATGARIADYYYDAGGRRSRKVVHGPAGQDGGEVSEDTAYAHDGWRVVEERQAGAAGATAVTYVYGPADIDDVLEMERTDAHPLGALELYLHHNARNDVVALTDGEGEVAERTLYDEYGRPSAASALANPYLFQGRRLDAESGLYEFRRRHYDPETGRFLQRDPVWDAGNAGNQYSFVGNSPVSGRDAMGTQDIVFGYDVYEDGAWGNGSGETNPEIQIDFSLYLSQPKLGITIVGPAEGSEGSSGGSFPGGGGEGLTPWVESFIDPFGYPGDGLNTEPTPLGDIGTRTSRWGRVGALARNYIDNGSPSSAFTPPTGWSDLVILVDGKPIGSDASLTGDGFGWSTGEGFGSLFDHYPSSPNPYDTGASLNNLDEPPVPGSNGSSPPPLLDLHRIFNPGPPIFLPEEPEDQTPETILDEIDEVLVLC